MLYEEKTLKNNNIDADEFASNKFILKCTYIILAYVSFAVVLNILDIFIIQSSLMYKSVIGGALCAVFSTIVEKTMPDKPITKYLLLGSMVAFVTVVGVFLTYHIVLVSVIPIICAAQYRNSKVILFTYAVSVISIFVMVMGGFYYGLCDANMLVLTNQINANHIDPSTGEFMLTVVNDNPWGTLPIYYGLPRCLVLFATVPVIKYIANVIAQNARRETELRILSETDMMTQLYNRNKYLEMIKDYYPTVDKVGVMFWDINDLKGVNDSMGHDSGDYLISSITTSIAHFLDDRCKAFRIGGDEFVVIAENVTREEIGEMVVKSKSSIAKKDIVSKIPISASVGYAIGSGKDIEQLISEADAAMYKDKRLYYEELENAKETGE